MADISKITLPSGTTYNIKDAYARQQIENLGNYTVFLGVTSTAITDGSTTNPITIAGQSVTAKTGDIVTYGSTEFIFNGTQWQAFGDLSALGEFAYVDAGNAQITPHGTVSRPTFTGTSSNVTITATDNTSGNYQPKGTVSQPSFTGSNSTFTGTFTPSGTIDVQVTKIVVNHVSVDTSYGDDYTPTGTVSRPTFTGASTTSTGTFTPEGSVSLTNSNQTTTVSKASSGTVTYTPEGSVSFTNTNKTATVSKASSGTATYTPEGSVAAPTISVATAGSTTTVNSITAVGTLPNLTTTVENENLTLGWSAGTLPTKGANQTVKTGDASYSASAPAFTGTGVRLVTDNISVPSSASFTGTGARLVTGNISVPSSASFSGTQGNVSVTGTPSGSVSQPTFTGDPVGLEYNLHTEYSGTFTGTAGSVSVSGTPNGSVSQPTFTGTKAQINGTVTPSGTVSQPTFTGTQESWAVHPGAPE